MHSWVEDAASSGYDSDHLPYGVFSLGEGEFAVGVRIGDFVLDLGAAAQVANPQWESLLRARSLNAFMAAGPETWLAVREWVTTLTTDRGRADAMVLHPLAAVTMHLPFEVADYVDYYASEHHASNVGQIFRPDQPPLLPNWKHLPVGYHGRAGSIVVSGTPVRRPVGQLKPASEVAPMFGPTRQLDIEAELGFVVGRELPHGRPATTGEFGTLVFGVTGVNDWSARDIQAWEYVPLGPNLGKSFATSISAWVTPLAALEAAQVSLSPQDPEVLPYLQEEQRFGYDIDVTVELNGEVVSRPPYSTMYWSPPQMLAHLTVNGARLRVGDFFASGTISGASRAQLGSFLELSWGGREPFIARGVERTFLEDGDEVALRYTAPGRLGGRIQLGEVRATIMPAE